ncbi:selenocysteine insertion sequence-binding protein 2-like [Daphnia carinata]|uniref:selenocysteine insertion sequence-binding protein 2-like n=1 Tax=Daphnia carinata TaxID=120202 RepID=UPI00257A737E|nr:selenocysteine insertion sequence-binding protein 2-like [Daphnia carinata]
MSRQNYRRQYLNHPQEAYSRGGPAEAAFTEFSQPYVYPDQGFEYYGVPYIPNIQTSESYWYNGGLDYNYSTMAATPSIMVPPFLATRSIFSADAPEFVSKHSALTTNGNSMDNAVQHPSIKKKKKKKKKATSTSLATSDLPCDDNEEKTKNTQGSSIEKQVCNPVQQSHPIKLGLPKSTIEDRSQLPADHSQMLQKIQPIKEAKSVRFQKTSEEEKKDVEEKKTEILAKNKLVKEAKSVRFQEVLGEDKKDLKIKKPEILTKSEPVKEAKSVRFQKPSGEEKERRAINNPKMSSKNESSGEAHSGTWSKPLSKANISQECSKGTLKMSFADKLKSTVPTKSPYLDWRDQRTNAVNAPIKPNPNINFFRDENAHTQQVTVTAADEAFDNDGFKTVSRKKSKDKKPETISEEAIKSLPDSKPCVSAEADAKKKLEKERKKIREKQKKKQAREEKLLAEKLAPKGQKVTIITPKLMEQFLQSGRRTVGPSKPVMKLNEDMFPALGKRGATGNVSESESEWETTEIEIVQKEPVVTQRNVKRSDPIEFDLMALITKKNTKKKTTSDNSKKNKSRPGLVANVLDRSAPTLSRGKIRNKKRKLSEIRKALLAAKAKKKIAHEKEVPVVRTNGTRPHVLHSKKFREYCDQMLTDQIDLLSRDMLYHLRMFQDRVYKKDPIKARMKKRLVAGLREVTKQVERNRVKIIFLAPDIQRCPETGGLDEAVKRLLDSARRLDLPIVYALSRRKLGRVLFKKVPVSCCGILNYQATEETWKQLTEAVTVARENYQQKLQELGLVGDVKEKVTKVDDPSHNTAAVDVEKKPDQTDTLLELMKLSLKNSH